MARSDSSADFHSFNTALHSSQLDQDDWVKKGTVHPRHAILRYRTETALRTSDVATAGACLNLLRVARLPIGDKGAVLSFQLFACQTLVAYHFSQESPSRSLKLLDDNDPGNPGLRQLLKSLRSALGGFRGWSDILDSMDKTLREDVQLKAPTRESLSPLVTAVHRIVL